MGYSLLGYEHEEDKDWIYLLRMEPFYSIVRRKESQKRDLQVKIKHNRSENYMK